MAYSESEPRDYHGRWSGGNSGGHASQVPTTTGHTPAAPAAHTPLVAYSKVHHGTITAEVPKLGKLGLGYKFTSTPKVINAPKAPSKRKSALQRRAAKTFGPGTVAS